MLLRKTAGFFLAALLFCALGCMLGGVFLLNTPNVARAEAQNLSSETDASLFLPNTYEQYLALNSPSDVALSDSYIAVADGKSLYLFDRQQNQYFVTTPSDDKTISKIGFTADERLFVSDTGASNSFYEYSFDNHALEQIIKINCSTFCISGDKLYTATISTDSTTISEYSISGIESENLGTRSLGTIGTNKTPSMTCLNGTLYCTIDDKVYHINLANETFNSSTQSSYLSLNTGDTNNVCSTCAHNNAFYYTADGGLYRAEFSATGNDAKKATCVLQGDSFGALTSYGGSLYCIRGKSVLKLAVGEDGTVSPTDYEITAASNSVNRLNAATDCVRAGNLIVTADTGNNRISVYNTETGEFQVIACAGVSLVATDGTTIAATCGNKVYVCNYGEDCFDEPTTADIGTIKGLACVNGSVYYITEYGYGKVEEVDKGLVSRLEDPLVALAADDNGILYVVDAKGYVRYYHENEFIDTSIASGGDMKLSLHLPVSSLRADREGNLYYLSEKTFWKNDEPLAEVENNSSVYGDESSPVAFALDFESDNVYLLYGNYIVKTGSGTLGIPSRNHSTILGNRQDILLPDSRRKRS